MGEYIGKYIKLQIMVILLTNRFDICEIFDYNICVFLYVLINLCKFGAWQLARELTLGNFGKKPG